MRKKVLIMTYHFPPSAAIGGMRAARFARHLPAFGWDPTVLTIEDRLVETLDPERLVEVAGIPVIKTGMFPTLRDLYLRLKRSLGRAVAAPPAVRRSPRPGTGVQETLFRKGKRWFVSLFMTLPDPEKGWILPAALRACREIRRKGIDCLVTSSPPHSVMVAGLLVKKLTRVGWIVDLRDPWTTVVRKTYPTSTLSDRIEAWIERTVFHNADLVLCNVERLRDLYRQKYTKEPAEKFQYIPNGIDLAGTSRSTRRYDRFTISYTGSLYFGRSPEPVFLAVRQLLDEGRLRPEQISIRLVGNCGSADPLIAACGLSTVVQVSGMVPRSEANEIISRSHVALLLAPDQPYQIPGKVYDYMAMGTPILAIAPPGATADIIAATGSGNAFSPSDIRGIKEFIHTRLSDRPVVPSARAQAGTAFDAVRLTGQLADQLEQVAPGNARCRSRPCREHVPGGRTTIKEKELKDACRTSTSK